MTLIAVKTRATVTAEGTLTPKVLRDIPPGEHPMVLPTGPVEGRIHTAKPLNR